MNMSSENIEKTLSELADISSSDDIRYRLMDAAMSCVQRWGIEKTSLNDIAREAGCARQTVYNYYKNRDAVIFAALMDSASRFSIDLMAHINTFDKPEDKIVEAIMYTLENLPNEPYLQWITDPKLTPVMNPEMFYSDMCLGTITKIAEECVKDQPEEVIKRSAEIGEMMTRLFLSLLVIKSPDERDDDAQREFLRRWLLPGVGLK